MADVKKNSRALFKTHLCKTVNLVFVWQQMSEAQRVSTDNVTSFFLWNDVLCLIFHGFSSYPGLTNSLNINCLYLTQQDDTGFTFVGLVLWKEYLEECMFLQRLFTVYMVTCRPWCTAVVCFYMFACSVEGPVILQQLLHSFIKSASL